MHPSQPASDATGSRPLPVLRAMIDAADREILQLLSRRNAIVGEIAQYKREHQVPIRDRQRERQILEDRSSYAASLGIPAALVESMFRLILWSSRDRQAALKAEVPPDVQPRTVAVIGGSGAMGRCMAGLFADLGHAVMVADLDTPLTPDEAARVADVVVISVPIDVTVPLIRRIAPLVRPDALLMDVTSIKSDPLAAMLESTAGAVIGTHPLFGPSVHSLQGQRIVLTPGRGDAWLAWLKQMLAARGLNVLETTAAEHDQAMSIVQVLTHFSTEVMGRTLSQSGASVERTLQFTSPIYLMELLMTARHFAQSPDLYASIQMSNPGTGGLTAAFVQAAEELRDIVQRKDRAAFERVFEQVRTHFGNFTQTALDQSSYLIDRLVERA